MKLLSMPKVGIVLDDTQYKRLRLNGDDTMYIHIHVQCICCSSWLYESRLIPSKCMYF